MGQSQRVGRRPRRLRRGLTGSTVGSRALRSPLTRTLLWGLVELVIIVICSQQVAGESKPGACNEVRREGTKLQAGCDFLEGGGYTALRIVPGLIVIGFILLAARKRRVGLVHLGFVLAFLLLVVSLAVSPSNFPWVEGTER